MEDLLEKVNVVVSPAASQFVPVTLPYGYKPVDLVAPVDTSSIPVIISDAENFLAGLTAKHESRIESFEKWRGEKLARDIAEKRKIAPGYLDGPNRILVPTYKDESPATRTEHKPDAQTDIPTDTKTESIEKSFETLEL